MNKPTCLERIFFALALFAALLVQGAIPFLAAPTMGQAVWTAGFSHSFANGGLFEIYAHNIGAPEPAPIAFGLAGAWPASLFIRLGLHAVDAYTAMAAFWLSIAFGSAYGIARHFQVARYHSTIAALCWMTMPVIWAHAGYSMVSLGIGLLSFYFLVAIKLMDGLRDERKITAWALLYVIACIISVFMDGYSFMMFAAGSSIMLGLQWMVCKNSELRKRLTLKLFPVQVIAFAIAYGLYSTYIGRSSFDSHSMDFFRGWGLDLSFIAIPTVGMHWIPDAAGWSVPRSDKIYWGDASVWTTTFILPLLLAGVWSSIKSAPQKNWKIALCIASLFAFYMSLGPSLKINTVKTPESITERVMDAKHAIAPTGSALLSKNLPGFNVMRASYRWLALGAFCTWLLLTLSLSRGNKRTVVFGALALTLTILALNLPNPENKWKSNTSHRNSFLQLDKDFLDPLREDLAAGERAAFLPWRNDFLVNYLASKAGVVAYNIGGDKNYQMAREHWPATMREFPMAAVDKGFAERILRLFSSNDVDVVILPFIDTLWAAHFWPHPNKELREQLNTVIESLRSEESVLIAVRENYAIVRMNKDSRSHAPNRAIANSSRPKCSPPSCLEVTSFGEYTLSRTGQFVDGVLHSTGTEGFVLFGPYQPMNAGVYSLVVHGEIESSSGSWVDVVSEKGKVIHGKWELSGTDVRAGRLMSATVEIDEPSQDLEVRVYARAADRILIRGYELRPILAHPAMP